MSVSRLCSFSLASIALALPSPAQSIAAPSSPTPPTSTTYGEGAERALLYPYRFEEVSSGVFTLQNSIHGLAGIVDATRVAVMPTAAGPPAWIAGLDLVGFGRDGAASPLPAPTLRARLNRLTLGYTPTVEGRVVNDFEGVEQLWVLSQPPAGSRSDPITLEFAVTGTLSFVIDPDARGGCFVDAAERVLAWYRNLRTWDANGAALASWIEETSAGIRICVDDETATYPITIDPLYTGPVWTRQGDAPFERFGASMSSGHDVNGDGIFDLVVGSPGYTNTMNEQGRAQLFLGAANGPSTSPAWSFEGSSSNAHLGHAVSVCGDVNGDGFAEVLVGEPDASGTYNLMGRAHLFLGSASGLSATPDWTFDGRNACGFLGEALTGAGDVNGDGYGDVVIGSRGDDHKGSALAFYGSASGLASTPDVVLTSSQVQSQFGRSLSFVDSNGDGYSDVVVGSPSFDLAGMPSVGGAHLYLGSAGGLSNVSDWAIAGTQADAELGRAVSTAGDTNGDGFQDFLVGEPNYSGPEPDEGRALLFLGTASVPSTTPSWTAEADRRDMHFGETLTGLGDVDGDGLSDVLIGAPEFRRFATAVGRVFLYVGGGAGLSTSPVWIVTATNLAARYGEAVDYAGDMNGDGEADALIGAPDDGNGRAYIHLGRAVSAP